MCDNARELQPLSVDHQRRTQTRDADRPFLGRQHRAVDSEHGQLEFVIARQLTSTDRWSHPCHCGATGRGQEGSGVRCYGHRHARSECVPTWANALSRGVSAGQRLVLENRERADQTATLRPVQVLHRDVHRGQANIRQCHREDHRAHTALTPNAPIRVTTFANAFRLATRNPRTLSPDLPARTSPIHTGPTESDMRVWIDQDLCTGDGLCTDHCPDLHKSPHNPAERSTPPARTSQPPLPHTVKLPQTISDLTRVPNVFSVQIASGAGLDPARLSARWIGSVTGYVHRQRATDGSSATPT